MTTPRPAAPAPPSQPRCAVCGTEVVMDAARCPSCGLSRPTATGATVLTRKGLWSLAAAFLAVYVVVLLIVASAR